MCGHARSCPTLRRAANWKWGTRGRRGAERERRSRLKGGCTVESPSYLIEIRPSLRCAFIPLNGAPRHRDSQDWLPHKAVRTGHMGNTFIRAHG